MRIDSYVVYGLDLSVPGSVKKKSVHGWSLSLLGQDHIDLRGVATAVLYNRARKCRGVQFSFLFNRCDDLKGIQIGLFNENQKRSFPIINFAF
jgi:hypothetical protein